MKAIKRILPVLCITAVILTISQLLYYEILEREEARCWQELSTTAQSIKKEITTKFMDEIVKLHLIEAIMLEDDVFEVDDLDSLHLGTIQPTTIFARIDILYPDNTLISNGIESVVDRDIHFADIAAKGEYLTSRKTDVETGKECVYYVLPVIKNDEIFAVIIGVIEAKSLSDIFRPIIYNGQANICIIDTEDGNYIMDSWHDELGNAYEMTERKKLKGFEEVDLQEALRNLETGAVAFESSTTGTPIYMYYTSMDMFDWQLSIFAQEEVFFGELIHFQRMFLFAGIVEIILLVLYFLWNISTVKQLEKSNAEIEKQKEKLRYISYRDMLTSMYNRNKYIEVWNSLREKKLQKAGAAYIDLNGLKQINDSQMHEAGDIYICNAAKVISEIFEENSYRIGGDEFVILAVDIEKNQFMDKMQTLQENMINKNISVSIGFLWEESCSNLDALLKEAEKRMYEEKQSYYLTHVRKSKEYK